MLAMDIRTLGIPLRKKDFRGRGYSPSPERDNLRAANASREEIRLSGVVDKHTERLNKMIAEREAMINERLRHQGLL